MSRHRTLSSLVVIEVMLSVVLLTAGGLMVRGMVAQMSADPGFNKTRLFTAVATLPKALYPEERQSAEFFRSVLDRLRSSPQVIAAAATQTVPLGGSNGWVPVFVETVREGSSRDENLVGHMVITPGYFETMGIPMMAGRAFAESDGPDAPKVAIVNQTMARRYWPDDPQPIGRRIKLGNGKGAWLTVAGVARDVRHQNAMLPARPEVYLPHAQSAMNSMVMLVRTHGDPHQAAQILRSAVWSVDSNQPLYSVQTMDELIDRRMAGPRATTQVMGFLALLALVLASVGIYGVVGYITAQRAREIGIRMALGAGRSGVFGMVLRGGLTLTGVGLVLGLGAASAVTPLLRSILAVKPHDTTTFVVTTLILLMVGVAAAVPPALRAIRLDPIQVLREE